MTYAGYRHFCAQNRPNSHGMKFAHLDLWIEINLARGERTGAARGGTLQLNCGKTRKFYYAITKVASYEILGIQIRF